MRFSRSPNARMVLGKNIEPGDRVVIADGQTTLTIERFSEGASSGSRIARYENSNDYSTVFDDMLYQVILRPDESATA